MATNWTLGLKRGDEVYWNDPDGGRCSRQLKIQEIEFCADFIRIVDEDGGVLEVLPEELS